VVKEANKSNKIMNEANRDKRDLTLTLTNDSNNNDENEENCNKN